jgi:hypothetical protein
MSQEEAQSSSVQEMEMIVVYTIASLLFLAFGFWIKNH